MKVYVDELPKSCAECECIYQEHSWDRYRCKFNGEHIEEDCRLKNSRLKTCPLQSLTDYTKQVRKEVVQEIRKQIKNECVIFDSEDDRKAFNKILKKIQGE